MMPEIFVTDDPHRSVQEVILPGLVAFNQAQRLSDWRPLGVLARGAEGAVLGGLAGSTAWGWLYIQYFWLPDGLRRCGLGSAILARAEEEARARGCHAVWLDTFSFQAPGFYLRRGYALFGALEDYPPGHRRFFLQKQLGEGAVRPPRSPA
ncbi:MAG TPA: GNAT family N-acetyltransferase [Stellaceae bacterium]|nr:GNAT family N-acetyltransferase [Stellaceae bacterium]